MEIQIFSVKYCCDLELTLHSQLRNLYLLALRAVFPDADSDLELWGLEDLGLADWGLPEEGVGRISEDMEGLADLGGVGVYLGDWTGGALFGLGGGDGVDRYRSLVSNGGTADILSVLEIT